MILMKHSFKNKSFRFMPSNETFVCELQTTARMENKENGSVDTKKFQNELLSWQGRVHLVENGQLPDPAEWAVLDVVNYFKAVGFEEQANAFQDQMLIVWRLITWRKKTEEEELGEIDGKSLLLMTRNDVLTGLSLKLGPALKIYEYHVKPLQTQHLKNNTS
ncbi:sterile alpha motif domain-containing protein 13 isoform X2 [Polypterus senegalus]|uniref:sterile alpha motif domain-containing protein 13 isoform X2 n=1 Tax=Polypterus senegalus TaxID=55291 RepID=UPI001963EA99|nr:sterile alpha motif domain-containing protein 13 isoform X2 [Polypterus senegalus]